MNQHILILCVSIYIDTFDVSIYRDTSPHLKLVLILSLATNNPFHTSHTSSSELTIFYNVGDPSNHTR